jgi:DNA-binding Lrp family transcriptional regulator
MDRPGLEREILLKIRQKQDSFQIDDFTLEFLRVWDFIHQQAPTLKLHDIKDFTESILKTITLPFYRKFKDLPIIEKYDSWVKSLSSIVINWSEVGRIMFPLRLVIYEVVNHQDELLDHCLRQITSGLMRGSSENIFNILFPRLINVAIPLTEMDILFLKALQPLHDKSMDIFKGATNEEISTELDVSTRTILRRIQTINFFQINIPMHFLDMAKLGYESFLASHFQPIPDELQPYCYSSTDLVFSQLSLFQIPISKSKIYMQLQDDLEPMIFQQMDQRIQNWNLSGLSVGKDGWKVPPSFLYSDPTQQIITTSPTMDVSLKPGFNTFRKLTPADIKIMEFITTTGALKTRKDLSNAVKVSQPETNSRLNEYQEHHLIHKIHQFFNIGLDFTITFFITFPNSYTFDWIPQLLSFPKADFFYAVDEQMTMFFGHVKLPPKWMKDFIIKVRTLKKKFPNLKFYYTASPPDIGKWSIKLSDTYF